MIYPSADRLEELVESRFTLVVLAAKRAKQLREGAPKLISTTSTNPLTIALEEIAAGKVTCFVPSTDEVITHEPEETLEVLPGLEAAALEEAAELTAEPAPIDEAARVAQLLEVPAEIEEEEETEAEAEVEAEAEAEPEPTSEEPAALPEEEPVAQAEEAVEEAEAAVEEE